MYFPDAVWVGKGGLPSTRKNNVDPTLRGQMEEQLRQRGLYTDCTGQVRFYCAKENDQGVGGSAVNRTVLETAADSHIFFGLRSGAGAWEIWELDVPALLNKYRSQRIPLNRASAASCGRQIESGAAE